MSPSVTPRRVRCDRAREGGYNLVALIVAITVLNIAVAAALPLWSTAMQREREEELIFRGLQYAEAIRVFQTRHGRLPVKLDELLKVEPRSIRQLWKDPMTGEVDWQLILAGGPGARVDGRRPGARPGRGGQRQNPVGTGLKPSDAPGLPRGPITGVRSRSSDSAIKQFFGHSSYDQWQFTMNLVTQGQVDPQKAAQSGHIVQNQTPRFNVQWIGRPFRPGITLPQGGSGPPGAGPPGGIGTPGRSGKRP